MTLNDIKKRIALGEDSTLEFKAVRATPSHILSPDARDIADEIAAAANSSGATFLFGVDDKTHKIQGIPLECLDVAETWVRNICNDSVKPSVIADIRKLTLPDSAGEDKAILCVIVPKSLFVHESPHGFFYRIGSSKRRMPPEMLARLFQQRSQSRFVCFDEQVVAQAKEEDLQPNLYSRFRTEISPSNDREFLRKLHFISKDLDGVMRPTVAGILFATEHPEEYLPSAYIQAVCYHGTSRNANDQLDARDIVGPLDFQISEACRFVMRNMRVAAIKNPGRIDVPQYAMNAVFEAIVNAVAHRDYSISGSKIRLHMFSDRLEIFSPGGLPNSLTIDEIGERQFSRNELICTCLSRCPLTEGLTNVLRTRMMDRRGEGVPVIYMATQKLAGKSPVYKLFGDSELMLTIFSAPIDDRASLEAIVKDLSTPSKGRLTNGLQIERIRELLRKNPQMTQAQLAKVLGLSRTSVANWIRKAGGTIRHIGSPNSGHWEVD